MKIIGFALCLDTDKEEDFERNKLYPVIEPLENDPEGHLRIVEESGEDYLYPEVYFQIVHLTSRAKESLLNYFELSAV